MAWEPRHSFSGQLHVGDVGWYLRLDDTTVNAGLHVWRGEDGKVAAVGLQHGDAMLLTAIQPRRRYDVELGEQMADDATTLLSAADGYLDAPQPSAVRTELARRGWDLDPDPWPILYRSLTASDRDRIDPDATTVSDAGLARDRLALQQAMFENSKSDSHSWGRMRDLTSYRPDLDVMIRQGDGYVAAATGWWAGEGKCGLLEPVGSHRDHRGRGYGRRVVLATLSALAVVGASGAAVFTPGSNKAALQLYRSCGFRAVSLAASMRSPSQATV